MGCERERENGGRGRRERGRRERGGVKEGVGREGGGEREKEGERVWL